MPNDTLSQAIQEAYASNPSDAVLLHTLEINHPNFSNPIRVVRNNKDIMATLEAGAPRNAGESVKFVGYPFDINLPRVDDNSAPRATLVIDNVSREIVENIELAVDSMQVIDMLYRPYLSDDLKVPHIDPPIHLTLTNIVADIFSVRADARFPSLANRNFPGRVYDPGVFRGLTR